MESIHESLSTPTSYNEEFLEFKKGFFSQRSNSIRRHNTITHTVTNNNSESNSTKSTSRFNSRRCSDSSYYSWAHDPISTSTIEMTSVEHESIKLDRVNSLSNEASLLTTPPPPITTNPFTKFARKLKKNSTSSDSSNQTTKTTTNYTVSDSISKPTSISSATTALLSSPKFPFPESVSHSSTGLHLNIPLKSRSMSLASSPVQIHNSVFPSNNDQLSSDSTTRRKTVPSIRMPEVAHPIIDISDNYFMKFGISNDINDDEESLYSIDVDYESDIYALSAKTEYPTSGWYLKDGLLIEHNDDAPDDVQVPVKNDEEVVADLVATDVLERLNY